MLNYEKYIPIVKEHYKSKEDLNKIITLLKEAGAGFIETLVTIRHVANIPLLELREITVNSPTWINEKEYIDEIQRIAEDAWYSDWPLPDDEQ